MSEAKGYFAGIDLGSTMTKVLLIDEEGQVIARRHGATGAEHRRLANRVMAQALEEAGLSLEQIDYIVATGYGRVNVPFADCQVTELSCHARGVGHLFNNARTAIDIGGQDAKALKIKDGRLIDFAMNDRCAAGTGRFLEVTATTLGIKLEEMGKLSLEATASVAIGNTCTIFAQQEIVGLITAGKPLPQILAGLHEAIARRVVEMSRGLTIEADVVLTGGVAQNEGVVRAISHSLDTKVLVPQEPLYSGALGAALLARDMAVRTSANGAAVPKRERRLEAARLYEEQQ
jgi:predicted CoA-substrate-specific enzyme activase